MSELAFTTPLFTILTALVEERAGLAYSLEDRSIFEGKVSARALEAGFDSALDYYYFLRYDDPDGSELQALVQALVVHETYFFREAAALRAAIDGFVAPRLAGGRRARVWCAASSTGEEPLTLAIMLAERELLGGVELVASDISAAALARARKNTFSSRAVRGELPAYAARYLQPAPTGYRVDPAMFEAIDWRQINLVDADTVGALGSFDVIVCRNVLIYFSDDTTRRVAAQLGARLRPGGILVVGVSESLLRFDVGLHCEEHGGVFVYRKVSP